MGSTLSGEIEPFEEQLGGWHEVDGGLELRSYHGIPMAQVRWAAVRGFRLDGGGAKGFRLHFEDWSEVKIYPSEPRYIELVRVALRELGAPSEETWSPKRSLSANGMSSEAAVIDDIRLGEFQILSPWGPLLALSLLKGGLRWAGVARDQSIWIAGALVLCFVLAMMAWRRAIEVRSSGMVVKNFRNHLQYDFADIADIRERWWGQVEFEFTDGRIVRTLSDDYLLDIVKGHIRRLDKS